MKRIILLSVISAFIVKAALAQGAVDTTQISKIYAGINSVPYCFAGSNSSLYPNYTMGYKRVLGRFTLRTGLSGNYGIRRDSLCTKQLFVMVNGGLEKKANIIKNRFFVVFAGEILASYKFKNWDKAHVDYFGFGVGPVIGLEYSFNLGKEAFSLSSETGFYLMQEFSTIREDNGRKSNDSRLISGLHRLAGVTLNYFF